MGSGRPAWSKPGVAPWSWGDPRPWTWLLRGVLGSIVFGGAFLGAGASAWAQPLGVLFALMLAMAVLAAIWVRRTKRPTGLRR